MTFFRCIQTTDAKTAFRQNVISKDLDDAVNKHQGHSGMTAHLHYQKDFMEDAALGICVLCICDVSILRSIIIIIIIITNKAH
jgi:hypothetical protein